MIDKVKYLYLPLEIVVREHDGKAMLAYEAAKLGWTIIMGPKISLYSICEQLPEGMFLVKSIVPNELKQLRKLKKAGHKVCSLDEEGVVTYKEFLGSNVRYSNETISEIEQIFFWGAKQQSIYNETFPEYIKKGYITGNPRLDFWRDHAADVYTNLAKKFKEKYGDYVLLPSSFGIANNILGSEYGVKLTKNQYGDRSKTIGAFLEGQAEQNLIAFKEYFDFLPVLTKKFSNINFIIRPHPSESHQAWESLSSNIKNLHLVYDNSVTPWILGSKIVFHFKSTTSIEAHIIGKPVVTYIPSYPEYMEKYQLGLPLEVSQVARSRNEVILFFSNILESKNEYKKGDIEGLLKDWIYVSPKHQSSKRILEKLLTHVPRPIRKLGKPSVFYKDKFISKLEKYLCFINRLSFLHMILPKQLRRNPNRISYGRHKLKGMNINHTKLLIKTIESKNNSEESVQARSFSNDLILIDKSG